MQLSTKHSDIESGDIFSFKMFNHIFKKKRVILPWLILCSFSIMFSIQQEGNGWSECDLLGPKKFLWYQKRLVGLKQIWKILQVGQVYLSNCLNLRILLLLNLHSADAAC